MKCFIHLTDEAVAVCKKCGKAMCGNCSAYSGHSGICPECRRNEFIFEKQGKEAELKKNKSKTLFNLFITVLIAVIAIVLGIAVHYALFIILAGSLFFGIKAIKLKVRRKPIEERINYLTGEIDKLNVPLNRIRAII